MYHNTSEIIKPNNTTDQLILSPSSGPTKSEAKNINPTSRIISERAIGFNVTRNIFESNDNNDTEFVKIFCG